MSANPRTFTVLAADKIGADNRQWIEVMPTCVEARNGPFFQTITRADLETYADSIRANPDKIPVDYDHGGNRHDGSTKAAGWFTGQARIDDTPDRGPILVAEVQWTPSGADAIRSGEFRMISAEYSFAQRAPKTGLLTRAKDFIAATLTNRPFFAQLAAVASELDDDELAAAAADLGVSVEKLVQVINQHGGSTASIEGDTVPETLKALAVELGLPEDATETQITEAVKAAKATAAKAKATTDELVTVKAENEKLKASAGDKTEIEKLREELDAEKKLRLDERRDSILTRAVAERRIDPATKIVLAESFADNIDGLEKILATYTPKPAGAHGGGGGREEGEEADDVAAAAAEFELDDGVKVITAGEGEAELHVRAVAILAARGKHDYSTEDYIAAYAEAERHPVAA